VKWAAAAPARDGTLQLWLAACSRESSYRRCGCRRTQTDRPGRSCPRVTSARPSGGLSARGARGGSRPSGARPATRLPVWTGTGLVGATGTDGQGQRHKDNQRDGVVHGVHGLSFPSSRSGPACRNSGSVAALRDDPAGPGLVSCRDDHGTVINPSQCGLLHCGRGSGRPYLRPGGYGYAGLTRMASRQWEGD
jgi:hypothetical protein